MFDWSRKLQDRSDERGNEELLICSYNMLQRLAGKRDLLRVSWVSYIACQEISRTNLRL